MINAIFRYATGRNVLIFMALTLVGMFILFPLLQNRLEKRSGGYGFMDLQIPTYTIDDAYTRLEAYGEAGRAYHKTIHLTADLFFPLLYGVAYALFIAWVWGRIAPVKGWVRYLPLLPLAATVFDYIENVLLISMMNQFPDQSNFLYRSAGSATFMKWTLQMLAFAVIGIGLLLWLAQRQSREVNV